MGVITYNVHVVGEREAVDPFATAATLQGLYTEVLLHVEVGSVQRPGEKEHGVVHEGHLSLEQHKAELT